RALNLLRNAELGGLVRDLQAVPLTSLRLAAGRAHAVLPLPTGAAVSRTAFDAALVRAAVAAGAVFLPGTTAALLPDEAADRRRLRLKSADDEGELECRVVLAATGLGGRFEDH